MAGASNIEWTDATWNPIVGCSIVSPGCTHCYAMKMAARIERMAEARRDGGLLGPMTHYAGTTKRVNGNDVWTGQVKQAFNVLTQPLRWKKPRRIFVNSMGDLFHESIPDEWIDRVFAVMALCPQHTFQVLTKRADRMREYLDARSDMGEGHMYRWMDAAALVLDDRVRAADLTLGQLFPLRNVWLGVSTERQQEANERIPLLLQTPAAVRFISAEPMLGPVDLIGTLARYQDSPNRRCAVPLGRPLLDWVIVGGESGHGARPMHPDWARSLRDQCADAGVPFFFKQWGEWGDYVDVVNTSRRHALCGLLAREPPLEKDWARSLDFLRSTKDVEHAGVIARVGKSAAGRLLDGKEHNGFPNTKEANS